MKKAGLNVGLMTGGGGQGGSTNASGGNVQNAGGGGGIEGMALMLQAQRQQAEIENIKADTKQKLADTKTTEDSRDVLIENMKQSGITTWLENISKKWKMTSNENDDNVYTMYNAIYGENAGYSNTSTEAKQLTADLMKTIAEKNNLDANKALTDEKTKGYFQELMNGTIHAEADKVKAAAIKLASEWGTGEYTNWKTWVDIGKDAVNILKDVLIKSK